MSYIPKIDLNLALKVANGSEYNTHRSGWIYALNSLKSLHKEQEIILDGSIETTFCRNLANKKIKNNSPYDQCWIGFVHNPPILPDWCHPTERLQNMFLTELWQKSLPYCQGFFCLSNYSKEWLSQNLDVPIVNLLLPTETPDLKFSVDAFISNENKSIVQVGNYLRRLYSIYQLPVPRMKKVLLSLDRKYMFMRLARELQYYKLTIDRESVEIISYLPDDEYDQLLSQNIVYLDLYDSSANNAIIECIVRNTPVLVNSLPAVKEYLGEDYPFYYDSREEAAHKAEDIDLIVETHKFLKSHPIKEKLTGEHFLKSFTESEIYQNLDGVVD